MYHPTVKGSYYEMGHNYGAILYRNGFKVSPQSAERLDFGIKSESEVKKFFPEILDEIQGFADSCHVSYEHLLGFIMSIGAFKVEPMCSVFATFTGSDVVLGRNYDFFYSFKKFVESYLTCPEDGYFSIGHSDVFIGREDGVNEKGLAIAMTGAIGKTVHPGINFIIAIRRILDKCATVKESIKVLSSAHFSTTSNYLITDRGGNMVVVEASPERVRVRKPEDKNNFIVCTNHFMHPDMLEFEDREERIRLNWDSKSRYSTIQSTLQQKNGRIDIETAEEILSNHSGYVCSHQENIKLGTIWSVIATLKNLIVLRAEGHPCKAKYKPDTRLEHALKRKIR